MMQIIHSGWLVDLQLMKDFIHPVRSEYRYSVIKVMQTRVTEGVY